jgi:hypothetical protein
MKEIHGAREPDPRSDNRMPTMQQGADRCRKRQECGLSALCPPSRVPHAEQRPQHEGESRPGRLKRVPLLPVRLTAQAGPARAAQSRTRGTRPFHPLRLDAIKEADQVHPEVHPRCHGLPPWNGGRLKEKPMTPELTIVMMFLSLLILLTGFPIAFWVRRFERLARVTAIMTARGKHVSTLWRQVAVTAAIACVFAAGQAQASGKDQPWFRVRPVSPLWGVC